MATAAEVFDLSGSVVWVTGSGRGIGAGLARHGASVAVHGRSAGSTQAIASELRESGGDVFEVHTDVRDGAAVEAAVAGIEARFGRLDSISPSLIRTEGSMAVVFRGSDELAARAGRTTAVGRIGEPDDIAWACHFLLSPAAAFISGTTLVVDGGPTEDPTQRIPSAIKEF